MNLGKEELDALLAKWPASQGSPGPDQERRWEDRADVIVKAAVASGGEGIPGEALDTLMAAPPLAVEHGEPGEAGGSGVVLFSGEKKASDPGTPMPAERRRTGSLKELAARASQAGARPSAPSVPPAAISASRPSQAPKADDDGSVAPKPALRTVPPRPIEAGKEDSGVIDLGVVAASATAQHVAAAEKAQPAQAGLFEDDPTVESAPSPVQKQAPAKVASVTVVTAKKNRTGPIAGVVIAALGLAAAYAIVQSKKTTQAPPAAVVAESRPATAPAPKVTSAPAQPEAHPQAPAAPTAQAAAEPGAAPAPAAGPEGKPTEPGRGALAAAPTEAPGTTPRGKEAAPDAKGAAPGKPGDLQHEMAVAVGATNAPKAADDGPTPEPASGGTRSQNVPEQPSQGAIAAAVNAVRGGAKACVAGADEASTATITFSSAGTVSSVSVGGWAAAHGKTGCVQAALKGANVGPFAKPSFSVPFTIRP